MIYENSVKTGLARFNLFVALNAAEIIRLFGRYEDTLLFKFSSSEHLT